MKIDIRKAGEADCEALAAVLNKTWRADYAGFIPPEDMESFTREGRREEQYRALMAAGADVFCVEVDKMIRGVCTVVRAEEGWLSDYCEIMQLYIDPEIQRIGLGRKLLSFALRTMRAKSYKRAYLWVISGNAKAERFYAKFGFKPDGLSENAGGFSVPVTADRYSIEL